MSQEVRCFRLLKYDVNHSKALGETPIDDNLDIKIPQINRAKRLTVRSKKTAPQMCKCANVQMCKWNVRERDSCRQVVLCYKDANNKGLYGNFYGFALNT